MRERTLAKRREARPGERDMYGKRGEEREKVGGRM